MDDGFLHEMRRDPDPAFAARLRGRLAAQGPAVVPARRSVSATAWRPALAIVAAAVAVVSLFAFPAVRASAQAFLDMFRVRNFTAIKVDPQRIDALEHGSLDLRALFSEDVETVREPGAPRVVDTEAAAAAAAGFALRTPAYLPAGIERDGLAVRDAGEARLTARAAKLRQVLQMLDLNDVGIPARLDGAQATVRTSPAVHMHYRRGERQVMFAQSPSPEVDLPRGLDLAQLGEIGLRIAGLSAGEARRLSRSIDWHTTLLVPVPSHASSFRDLSVNGEHGLLIHTTEGTENVPGGGRGGDLILWSTGDRVYALGGNIPQTELVQMANSVR